MAWASAGRTSILAAGLLLVLPGSGVAQSIRGVVRDELSGSAVEGAAVLVLSAEMNLLGSTSTDAAGEFELVVSPVGAAAHLLVEADGFSRLLSDPLASESVIEVGVLRLRPLGWAPALVSEIELDARTVAGWCAGETEPVREGILVGRIRDQLSGEGLAGFTVFVDWGSAPDAPRIVVGGAESASRSTRISGPGGLYYFCRVPSGRAVEVVVRLPQGTTVAESVDVDPSAVTRLDLTIPFTRPGESGALFGRVVDGETGRPIEQARVSLRGENAWALTNDRGFFSLEGLPTGMQILDVEHLAYARRSNPLILEPGSAGQVTIEMAVEAIELEGLRVTVRSSRRLAGIRELERRRELGIGSVFDAEEIRRRGIYYLGDVLRETPGMGARIVGRGLDRRYVIRRVRRGQEYCVPAVFINGRRYRLPNGLLEFSASEMEVVEVHRAPGIPPEFVTFDGTASGCGVVSAWTRVGA